MSKFMFIVAVIVSLSVFGSSQLHAQNAWTAGPPICLIHSLSPNQISGGESLELIIDLFGVPG